MRTLVHLAVPLACVLAACGPSDNKEADADRAKAARAAAAVGGLAEPPVDLGEGLILTVLQRGSGAFVSAGGRVRVHYDASVVAVAEAPVEEPAEDALDGVPAADAQAPAEGSPPVEDAATSSEGATDPAAEAASDAEPVAETPQEPAADAAPAADATASATRAPDPTAAAEVATDGAPADPAAPAPAPEEAAAPAAESSQPALPRRFDSSRARGVPDTWDLSRTASPRLIEGLRRGLVGLTAGSRLTLRVPAALAWGDEGLRDANVPPRADVLYEIELLEVLP